jgi:uncharacterized protein (DUF1330 family)
MAKGYWIARVDITDPEGYKGYLNANAVAFARYAARFLVRSGRFELKDGSARGRNIIIEFPSYEAALACWDSPEYQRAIPHRTKHSVGDIIIIEGYDGPQP